MSHDKIIFEKKFKLLKLPWPDKMGLDWLFEFLMDWIWLDKDEAEVEDESFEILTFLAFGHDINCLLDVERLDLDLWLFKAKIFGYKVMKIVSIFFLVGLNNKIKQPSQKNIYIYTKENWKTSSNLHIQESNLVTIKIKNPNHWMITIIGQNKISSVKLNHHLIRIPNR